MLAEMRRRRRSHVTRSVRSASNPRSSRPRQSQLLPHRPAVAALQPLATQLAQTRATTRSHSMWPGTPRQSGRSCAPTSPRGGKM